MYTSVYVIVHTYIHVHVHVLEEAGHDAHIRYSHMTLVCTSWRYVFRMQFVRVDLELVAKMFVSVNYGQI